MSLSLLLPAALLGLAALAIPLLLHVQRRQVLPPRILFAAMRWISQPPRPRRRLQFREPWLLLLRCLLVVTLVLALAQPVMRGMHADVPWEVVLPGVDAAAVDWLHDENAERRWLAEGFPPLADAAPRPGNATASLIRELDALLPTSTPLVLHVPAQIGGLDGGRLALGRRVEWIVAPSSPDAGPLPAGMASAPPRIVVAGMPADHPARPYLQAAHRAWHGAPRASDAGVQASDAADVEPNTLPELTPDTAPAAHVDATLWLSAAPLPPELRDWLASGGRVLAIGASPDDDAGVRLWRGEQGAVLRGARIGRGELRLLDCPLDPRCMPEVLDAGFPQLLQTWLTPDPPAPDRADAVHVKPSVVDRTAPEPVQLLLPWLAWLAGLLFLVERWLANGRRAP
jgi:hypothetical protein